MYQKVERITGSIAKYFSDFIMTDTRSYQK